MGFMSEKSKRVEKFEELAEKRVNDVVKKLRLIGNLSNRSNYEYTEEHVKQIFNALKKELKDSESRFLSGPEITGDGFKFKN